MRDPVLGQLGLEVGQRVGFEAMARAGDERLSRVGADKAIASNALVGGGGFEEEGEL